MRVHEYPTSGLELLLDYRCWSRFALRLCKYTFPISWSVYLHYFIFSPHTSQTMSSREKRATRKLCFGEKSDLEESGHVEDNAFYSSSDGEVDDNVDDPDFEEYVYIVN